MPQVLPADSVRSLVLRAAAPVHFFRRFRKSQPEHFRRRGRGQERLYQRSASRFQKALAVGVSAFLLVTAHVGAAIANPPSSQTLDLTLPASSSSAPDSPAASSPAGSSSGGNSSAGNSSSADPSGSPGGASTTNPGPGELPPPNFNNPTIIAIANVNQDGAQILRRTGPSSMQVLFTCSNGQTVGIVGQMAEWYCVLMADHTLGCILTDRVTVTWQRPTGAPEVPQSRPAPLPDPLHGVPAVLFPDLPRIGASSVAGFRVVDNAIHYLGVRYHWGGNTAEGIDCSGLVKAVFKQEGVELPRTAREQAEVGVPVSIETMQPGDRLSFCCKGSTIDHTGIYIGNGMFIHASGSKGQVCITRLEGGYLRWLKGIHRDFH